LSDRTRGTLHVLFGAFLWGTMVVTTRGITWIQPTTIAVARAGLAALGCVLWLGVRNPRLLSVAPRDLLWLFFYGGATAGLMYAGFTIALSRLSVATCEVIFYTFPFFTTLLGVFVLRERPSGMQVFSCFLILLGVACMTMLTGEEGLGTSFPPEGVIAATLAMSGMTIQSLVARKNAQKNRMPTETLFSWAQIFGFVWIALYKSLTTGWSDVPDVTPASWLILAYMGLVCTLAGYGAYNLGLRFISAATASMLASFEMITAVVLAALALDAVPTPGEVLGSAVILAALVPGTRGVGREKA